MSGKAPTHHGRQRVEPDPPPSRVAGFQPDTCDFTIVSDWQIDPRRSEVRGIWQDESGPRE